MLHKSCSCGIRLEIIGRRDQLKENKLLSYSKIVKLQLKTISDGWAVPDVYHFPPPSPYT